MLWADGGPTAASIAAHLNMNTDAHVKGTDTLLRMDVLSCDTISLFSYSSL